jgi:hypothetical protein
MGVLEVGITGREWMGKPARGIGGGQTCNRPTEEKQPEEKPPEEELPRRNGRREPGARAAEPTRGAGNGFGGRSGQKQTNNNHRESATTFKKKRLPSDISWCHVQTELTRSTLVDIS